jgi:hypothetical protein
MRLRRIRQRGRARRARELVRAVIRPVTVVRPARSRGDVVSHRDDRAREDGVVGALDAEVHRCGVIFGRDAARRVWEERGNAEECGGEGEHVTH